MSTSFGLDVGGTKVLGIALDPADPHEVLASRRVATPLESSELLEALAATVLALTDEVGPPDTVGVGVPGLVDHGGVLRFGPHLPGMIDLPVAGWLSERIGAPVVADNDGNCAALGEQQVGAAEGFDDAVVLTLGTGIGGGVIVGGRLVKGAAGFAGEVGHMVVDAAGPPCPCGRRGCWERFASGTGLSRLARDAALAGRVDAVVELAGGDPEAVRGEHVAEAARQRDPGAVEVLEELAEWIARGIANLANIVDPGVIVLGGGLIGSADLFLPAVHRRFHERLMAADRRPAIPIVAAALGDRAGAVGAALLPGHG